MRIGINALFLQKPMVAAGLHLYYLLEGLDAYDRRNEYVLLSPRFRKAYTSGFPQLPSDRFRNVEVWTKISRFGDNVEKLWWEQIGLVQAATREKVDLLHCPYFAAPLTQTCPTVVTIHDVIPLVLPEYKARESNRLYTGLTSFTSKRANAIIAVSECSRRDIVSTLGIPADRIHVIGNAVHPSFHPITDSWLLAAVRERYNIARKYILYFGGFDLRKNVRRIIRSYAALPAPLRAEYQLVIAGRLHLLGHPLYPDPRPLVRELDMGDRIIFTGQIREQDKAPLYSGATAFVFPSLYEGFGMPVLEAMACGAPVITSRVSALPEVVGDAGVLVDPYSEPAISDALGELLTSPKRRQDLGQRARERSRMFSWRQVAEQTVSVYEQVAAGA
ncbi:MAG: glycosyltransferase family 4 protein [Chloroflexi bacterium]|nr:glycosyltransferase family 4 protein [Chloroflexota bacterium]